MKGIMKADIVTEKLEYLTNIPFFNSDYDAREGKNGVHFNNASYWAIYNKGTSRTTSSAFSLPLYFDKPFKINMAYSTYNSTSRSVITVKSYDKYVALPYTIDNNIDDRSSYHKIYMITVGATYYDSVHLAGYYLLNDEDRPITDFITMRLTHIKPKRYQCFAFNKDGKYYAFKH